jgi:hypothetical protein
MDFRTIVIQVLSEDMTSGGADSVYGSGVVSTETPFSGDNYAKGDARNIYGGAFPGVMTRKGMVGKRKYSYKKHANKKRKKKK